MTQQYIDKTIRKLLEKYLPGYAYEILEIDQKYGGKLGETTAESHKEELALLELYIKTITPLLSALLKASEVEAELKALSWSRQANRTDLEVVNCINSLGAELNQLKKGQP